jgi:hypothetical protein
MSPRKPTIKSLTAEKLPPQPLSATTNRRVSSEAQRIISAAQVEAIRRARRRRG